jgi:hypothetical protein
MQKVKPTKIRKNVSLISYDYAGKSAPSVLDVKRELK